MSGCIIGSVSGNNSFGNLSPTGTNIFSTAYYVSNGGTVHGSANAGMTVTANGGTLSGGTLTMLTITGPYSTTGSTVGVMGFSGGTSATGGWTNPGNILLGSGTANIGGTIVTPSLLPPHRGSQSVPKPKIKRQQYAVLGKRVELEDE